MYKLSKKELQSTQKSAENLFIEETIKEILDDGFYGQTSHLSKEEKYQFVKRAFSEAEGYGIELKPDYWYWLIVEFTLGEDFMKSPLYKVTISNYMYRENNKQVLDIDGLCEEVIEWINSDVLPVDTGIGRHLKDFIPIEAQDTKTYLQTLKLKDTKKYECMGEKNILDFLKEAQRNFSQYPFKDNKDKGYWYLSLAWFLGVDFLINVCYHDLKEVFLKSEDTQEIQIYMNLHIEQYHDWFEKQ